MSTAIADYTKLSIPERLSLIGAIWESVVAEGEPIGLTEAQKEELDRRLEDIKSGKARLIDWEDVKLTARHER